MLRILTYNAGLLKIKLFGRTLVEPAPFTDERLPCLAPALLKLNADIIALQEVYEPAHQAQLVRDLSRAYPHHAVSPTRRMRPLGAALMIFSKFPIVDAQYILFKDIPPDERLFVDKGMIVAGINAGSLGMIKFVNTHCTSGGAIHSPEGKYADRARNKQYRQIFDVLSRDRSLPHFAVGDFNAGPEASADNYRELQSYGFSSAWTACHGASAPTWDPKNELNAHGPHRSTAAQRMDHIFFKDGPRGAIRATSADIVLSEKCVSVLGGPVTISDHYGLMAGME